MKGTSLEQVWRLANEVKMSMQMAKRQDDWIFVSPRQVSPVEVLGGFTNVNELACRRF